MCDARPNTDSRDADRDEGEIEQNGASVAEPRKQAR
jgi:hypothetical protein